MVPLSQNSCKYSWKIWAVAWIFGLVCFALYNFVQSVSTGVIYRFTLSTKCENDFAKSHMLQQLCRLRCVAICNAHTKRNGNLNGGACNCFDVCRTFKIQFKHTCEVLAKTVQAEIKKCLFILCSSSLVDSVSVSIVPIFSLARAVYFFFSF